MKKYYLMTMKKFFLVWGVFGVLKKYFGLLKVFIVQLSVMLEGIPLIQVTKKFVKAHTDKEIEIALGFAGQEHRLQIVVFRVPLTLLALGAVIVD